MEAKVKNAYKQEIVYQSKLLKKLKSWLRNLMIISSLTIIMIVYTSHHLIIMIILSLILILVCIAMIIIGLAIRNGSINIKNILVKIQPE